MLWRVKIVYIVSFRVHLGGYLKQPLEFINSEVHIWRSLEATLSGMYQSKHTNKKKHRKCSREPLQDKNEDRISIALDQALEE